MRGQKPHELHMVHIMWAYTDSAFAKLPTRLRASPPTFVILIELHETLACVSSRLQSDAATAWLLPRSFKWRWPKKVFIVDACTRFISLEGSERPAIVAGVSDRLRITDMKWKQRDLPQLLPMYTSSIKSVVLPNPTTKQGRCVHTLTAERRNTWNTLRGLTEPMEPGVVWKQGSKSTHSRVLNLFSVYLQFI